VILHGFVRLLGYVALRQFKPLWGMSSLYTFLSTLQECIQQLPSYLMSCMQCSFCQQFFYLCQFFFIFLHPHPVFFCEVIVDLEFGLEFQSLK